MIPPMNKTRRGSWLISVNALLERLIIAAPSTGADHREPTRLPGLESRWNG